MARIMREVTLLDAAGSTGAGTTVPVEEFNEVVVSVATDGGSDANLTVQFQGSIQDSVDFDSGASVTNMWDYLDVIDLQDKSSVDGSAGFVVSGADDYRLFKLNPLRFCGLKYFTANVTARSEGEVTVKALFVTSHNG